MKRAVPIIAAVLAGAVFGGGLSLALTDDGASREGASPGRPPTRERPLPSPIPVLGDVTVSTLLSWTPGGLPEGYAAAVRDLPSVASAVVVRSGVAWLRAWTDRDGTTDRPPPGFMVPVEVAAIEPARYQGFVPPAERAVFGQLERGGAVLSRTAAVIRGIGPGGTLRFPGTALRVRAVVDDELVGAHEVMVSNETGSALGIERPRYLLVDPRRGVPARRVEAGLRRAVPPGVRVRVRGPGETPVFRHGDAVLPPLRLKELFGEFAAAPRPDGTLGVDPRWSRENIRTARVPVLGTVTCHRRIIPQLRAALEELTRRGLAHLVDPADFGGCYYPRFIARDPGAALSHHSWGIAVDLNVSENPLGAESRQDHRLVDIFQRWGFTWGGQWLVPDAMHFEFLRFPLSPKA